MNFLSVLHDQHCPSTSSIFYSMPVSSMNYQQTHQSYTASKTYHQQCLKAERLQHHLIIE